MTLLIAGWSLTSIWYSTASTMKTRLWRFTVCCEVLGICRSIWNKFKFECCGQCSTTKIPGHSTRDFLRRRGCLIQTASFPCRGCKILARIAVAPPGLLDYTVDLYSVLYFLVSFKPKEASLRTICFNSRASLRSVFWARSVTPCCPSPSRPASTACCFCWRRSASAS